MKRIVALLMALLMLLAMAGCGQKEEKKAAASDVVVSEEQTETQSTIVPNQSADEGSSEKQEQEKTPVKEPEKNPEKTEITQRPVEKQEEPTKQPVGQQKEPEETEETVDPDELAEQKKEQNREQLAKKLEGTWTRTHTKYLLYNGLDEPKEGKITLPMTVEFKDGMVSIRFDTTDITEARLLSIYRPYYQERLSNKAYVEENAKRQAESMLKYLNQELVYEYELYDSKTLLVDGVDAGTVSIYGDKLNWVLAEDYYDVNKMAFTKVP